MAFLSSGPWWAPLIREHGDQIAGAVADELGAIRARSVDVRLDGDTVVVTVVTGDRDLAVVERLTDSALARILPEDVPWRIDVRRPGRGPLTAVD